MDTNTAPNARSSGTEARPQRADRDEYLLDEAIEETFPASDPPAETQPGSIVAQRHAATPTPAAKPRSFGWLPFAALAAGAAVAAIALRRRA